MGCSPRAIRTAPVRSASAGLPGGGYAFASESCALDGSGTPFLRDIAPGELVEAEDDGLHTLLPPSLRSRALCALEPLAAGARRLGA